MSAQDDANLDPRGIAPRDTGSDLEGAGRCSHMALAVSVIFGAALVALSLRPGLASTLLGLFFLTAMFWLPAVGIAAVAALVVRLRSPARKRRHSIFAARVLLPTCAVVVACAVVAASGIPRRIVFRACLDEFTALRESGDAGSESSRRIGVWTVDRHASDPRGGVYFRTGTAMDGISPDTMSYGFAYRPNPDGTPFGNAGYRISEVAPDWYCFRVSNDW